MKLSTTDQDKIKQWIGTKCGQMRCFACGQGRWGIGEVSTLAIGFDTHTTRFHYHEGMPLVSLLCENCGHVVNFSPHIIGLRPDQPPAQPQA